MILKWGIWSRLHDLYSPQLQISHLYGLTDEWDNIWRLRYVGLLNPFPQIGHLFGPSVLSDPCFTPSPVEALLTVGGEVIVFGVCKPFPRELSMLVLSLVATSAEDWGDA